MDEVYQRELKWVGLIGIEGKEIDTPKFREDTINNYKRIKDIKDGFGYARQLIAILSSKNRIKKVLSIFRDTFRSEAQFYIQLLYKPYLRPFILKFGLFGSNGKNLN